MHGRHVVLLATVLLAAGLRSAPLAAAQESDDSGRPPNIVLMLADNLGYGDLGCYGNRTIRSPNIDRLAAEGVRCTDFYAASPTCTVSRASLLTGRYPQRHGLNVQLPGIEGNYDVGLNQSEVLIPRVLAGAGYHTACFGKWNIGFAEGSRPTERGFHEFFGHASGNIDYFRHVYAGKHDLYRGTEPAHVEGYSTDLFADAACEYIGRHAREPFFVYVPFNAPHFPQARNKAPGQPNIWQAPPRAFAAYGYDPDTKDPQQRYHAVVSAMDEGVGRILRQIDDLELRDNTLVVFYSDNGAFMLPGRGLEVASNKPLRDGGVTLWEGGIRVPCLVRWPGRFPSGSVCREPLFSCDWLPLFARSAGAALPDDRVIDGRDPTQALAGTSPSPHDAIFFQFRKQSAVRSGRFKLLRTAPDEPFQLFDLQSDVSETTDIAADQPETAARLQQMYEAWLADVSQ